MRMRNLSLNLTLFLFTSMFLAACGGNDGQVHIPHDGTTIDQWENGETGGSDGNGSINGTGSGAGNGSGSGYGNGDSYGSGNGYGSGSAGSGGNGSGSGWSGGSTAPRSTYDERALRVLKRATAECPGECNDSVAFLVASEEVTDEHVVTGLCSATLIASDLMLTNSHCIPERYKRGESCVDKIRFIFPTTQTRMTEDAWCSSVVYTSQIPQQSRMRMNEAKPDVAMVRLQSRPGRPILELDVNGIPDGSRLTVFKMNPVGQGKSLVSEMKKAVCEAVVDTDVLPQYVGSLSSMFLAKHCTDNVIHGNSGSSVLNDYGQILGVIQGVASSNGETAIGSNIACVNASGLNQRSSSCQN